MGQNQDFAAAWSPAAKVEASDLPSGPVGSAGLTQGYALESMILFIGERELAGRQVLRVKARITSSNGERSRLARKSAHSNAARKFDSPADQLAMDAVDRAYLARFTLGNAALEREVSSCSRPRRRSICSACTRLTA